MSVPAQWHQQYQQPHPVGKKPKVTRLGIIVATVVLAGVGVMIYFIATSTPDVGECAEAKEKDHGKVELVQADCGSSEAMYYVADTVTARSPKCPDGDYKTTRDTGSRKSRTDTLTCYTLNVKEGDCLKAHKYANNTLSERVPCASAELKVAKVVEGKADDTLCSGGLEAYTYSKPAKTICMVKP
ncbi:hypothetical protein Lesp02_27240 [Lentzea sp. NBRC 105346]|uniref:LppU/SCO3897 family protein n=1 Tax=Lentzea sp. NBRC 105346 TaxID=3032205 RepID=UPI002552DCA0|nr:hypothetical protein [Lentzea sp. NBRC 105346]GLZ30535.1 hypothetical protein Lesp02_27240 [Lentzea sp. NBRC 105346]